MADAADPVNAHVDIRTKVVNVPIRTTHHRWQESGSLIQNIDIVQKQSTAGLMVTDGQAVIFAPEEGENKQKLSELVNYLTGKGYSVYPDRRADSEHNKGQLREALVVGGILTDRQKEKLFKTLAEGGYLSGTPVPGETTERTVPVTQSKVSTNDFFGRALRAVEGINGWLDRKTGATATDRLKFAGQVGLVGHAALAAAGVTEKDPNRIQTALLYGSSAGIQAVYGAGAGILDPQPIIASMNDQLAKHGWALAKDELEVQQEIARAKRNALQHAEGALAKHPVQIAQGLGSTGNVTMILSGAGQEGTFKDKIGRLAHGIAGLTGALAVMFLPEKAPETDPVKIQENAEKEAAMPAINRPFKKVFDFIQYSPFFFSASLQLLDNFAMIWDAFRIKQRRSEILEGYEQKPSLLDRLRGKRETVTVPPVDEQIRRKVAEYNQLVHNQGIRPVDVTLLNTAAGLNFEALHEGMGGLDKALQLKEDIQKLETTWFRANNIGKFSPVLAAITASSYTFATLLAMFSSKNADASLSTEDAYEPVIAIAARKVTQQPQEIDQGKLINKMAEILAADSRIPLRAEVISARIAEKVKAGIGKGIWAPQMRQGEGPKAAPGEDMAAKARTFTDSLRTVARQTPTGAVAPV